MFIVVTNGQDPLTKPSLEYLISHYGIPASDIKAITLHSPVGDVQTLTVTLLVNRAALETQALREAQKAPRRAPDDTAEIERPISHAPTTCCYPVKSASAVPGGVWPCGELIRWQGNRDEWVHANDERLGASDHPATPPE
jgi:hypothetical protein